VNSNDDTSDRPETSRVVGRERFPELRQLFGGYLFQDWSHLYESAEEAIDDAVARYSDGRLSATLAQLNELRTLGLSEEELDDVLLYDLSCNYNVEADGLTNSQWLEAVAAQLCEALQARRL
jgi:hypothetical protein